MKAIALLISLAAPAGAVDFDGAAPGRAPAFAAFSVQAAAIRPTAPAPAAPFAPVELDELRETVKRLFAVWYVQRYQNGFWDFVATGSLLEKQLRKETDEDVPRPFSGAFQPTPDAKTLVISAEPVLWEAQTRIPVLNDPKADGFIVAPGRDYLLEGLGLEDKKARDYARQLGLPGRAPFVAVVYHVTGEGYTTEGLALFWAKQEGRWRLFGLAGFD